MTDIYDIEPEDVPPELVAEWAHNLINIVRSGVALGGYFFAEDKNDEPMTMHHEVGEAMLRGRVWFRYGTYEQEITLKLLTSPRPLPC